MSGAKRTCQLDGCNRGAAACCLCCSKNVCTRHFNEHVDAIKAQLDPLADQTNLLVEKVRSLTVEQLTQTATGQLQQWKNDIHQLIDEIYVAKSKELEDLVETNKDKFHEHQENQLKQMIEIQDEMRQLVEDGDATYEHIQRVKNRLAATERSLIAFGKDFLSIDTKVPDQGLVTISSNLNHRSINRPPPPKSEKSQNTSSSGGIGSSTNTATTTATAAKTFFPFSSDDSAFMSNSTHTQPSSIPTVTSPSFGNTSFFGTQTAADINSKTQFTYKPPPSQGTAGSGFSFATPTTTASSIFAAFSTTSPSASSAPQGSSSFSFGPTTTSTPSTFGGFTTASPSASSVPQGSNLYGFGSTATTASPSTLNTSQAGNVFGFGSTATTGTPLFGPTTTTTPALFATTATTPSFVFGGRK